MLERVLEPEVMDTAEEASDYDAMDHAAVNRQFCIDLLDHGAVGPAVLDVGTGTAQIPVALCRLVPGLVIVAVDLATNMIAVAEKNIVREALQNQIMLERVDAKGLPYPDGKFETTVSNSLVHHIPNPRVVLSEMHRVTAPGGLVFVRDLARPSSEEELEHLMRLHGGTPPEDPAKLASFENQRGLLRASLHAALRVGEVQELAAASGMVGAVVRMTSDRHWTLSFRKP